MRFGLISVVPPNEQVEQEYDGGHNQADIADDAGGWISAKELEQQAAAAKQNQGNYRGCIAEWVLHVKKPQKAVLSRF